jgi:hypothetical protein
MKLYTEQQVNVAMRLMVDDRATFKQVLEQLTPIELPSDEQIEELSKNINFEYDYFNYGFVRGAEWIKEQILKQNQ